MTRREIARRFAKIWAIELIALIFVMGFNGQAKAEHANQDTTGFYPHAGVVTYIGDVEIIDGLFTTEIEITDCENRSWRWYDDAEDWQIGDLAAVIMCDNGTEIVYDDSIVSACYIGVPEWYAGIVG